MSEKIIDPFVQGPSNLKTRLGATKEMDRRRTKNPPAIQFHAAATLVQPGDPFSSDPEKRQDLAGEIAQFCIDIDPKWVGNLKGSQVEQIFKNLPKPEH